MKFPFAATNSRARTLPNITAATNGRLRIDWQAMVLRVLIELDCAGTARILEHIQRIYDVTWVKGWKKRVYDALLTVSPCREPII